MSKFESIDDFFTLLVQRMFEFVHDKLRGACWVDGNFILERAVWSSGQGTENVQMWDLNQYDVPQSCVVVFLINLREIDLF